MIPFFRVREAFRASSIEFGSAPGFGGKLTLVCLWLFYRSLNLLGFSSENQAGSIDARVLIPAVEQFAEVDGFGSVCNFQLSDGRIFTVMVIRVKGVGPQQVMSHV